MGVMNWELTLSILVNVAAIAFFAGNLSANQKLLKESIAEIKISFDEKAKELKTGFDEKVKEIKEEFNEKVRDIKESLNIKIEDNSRFNFWSDVLPFLLPIYVTCLVIYVIGVSLTACRISKLEKEHIRTFIIFSKGVFLTHVVYGINFLIGIVKKPRLKLKNYDKKTGNYLEG